MHEKCVQATEKCTQKFFPTAEGQATSIIAPLYFLLHASELPEISNANLALYPNPKVDTFVSHV